MSDARRELDGRFRESARFSNFGNTINRIVVKGIRSHLDTDVEIRSPITAFSGLNGTGKTTLLHLAAAVYNSANGYVISSFLAKGPLDTTPFIDDASVQVFLQGTSSRSTSLTLSYNPKSQRWQGYPRRQQREVFFFGVGFFLPQSEKRDFVFRNARALSLTGTTDLEPAVQTWCKRILSSGYDGIQSVTVSHRNRQAEVLYAKRGALSYSEAHMGCGEGRIHNLLRTLEACPEKSLVLLEEPEISLHPKAEYELGKYLIDLANRRGHQIFITTHSERLMRALPQASLVYLCRQDGVVKGLPGIASYEAESLMSEGHDKALTIIVEDEAAKIVLTELLRHHDCHFLKTVHIAVARHRRNDGQIEASGKDAIRQTMKTLSEAGIKIAAVLDGDDHADHRNSIHKLPGTRPPEKELVASVAVLAMIEKAYGLQSDEVTRLLQDEDCHDYFDLIGRIVSCDADFVMREASRAYSHAIAPSTANQLIEQLKEDASRQ
ncbi:AAA family ATPase [Blastopirellula sp. J2-11]|uniref:ATP-dependent nuclease n=1 Tax=Blastopirellula sp. J2-11 TaxID=2943192 RepID=UPI0021C5E00A|nr:AAA family ATPase [Blastopirellula sp. J2-11]UUO07887.1 AAA family ATPase [Blastopirellula sp. J2-11]